MRGEFVNSGNGASIVRSSLSEAFREIWHRRLRGVFRSAGLLIDRSALPHRRGLCEPPVIVLKKNL